MIALVSPPVAAPTITDSAVAMNSALPSPQPSRKPAIWNTLPDRPASAEKTTTSARPTSSVRRGPIRLADQPVTSIEMPGHREVAGEQQRHLARRGVEVVGEHGEDGIDEADAHEGDDAGEGDGPHGARLVEEAVSHMAINLVEGGEGGGERRAGVVVEEIEPGLQAPRRVRRARRRAGRGRRRSARPGPRVRRRGRRSCGRGRRPRAGRSARSSSAGRRARRRPDR